MTCNRVQFFPRPQLLHSISPRNLLPLLAPHRNYFEGQGLSLSVDADLDYAALADVVMLPDSEVPPELLEALSLIHELATAEGMDALLDGSRERNIDLNLGHDASPADVAARAWCKNPELARRAHAERANPPMRTFRTYCATGGEPGKRIEAIMRLEIQWLEDELSNWFEARNRGRGCRIQVHRQEDFLWFLVSRGGLVRRKADFQKESLPGATYRPREVDVLLYNARSREIHICAGRPQENDFYSRKFGLWLFGSEDVFTEETRYTLDPLTGRAEEALTCVDVSGITSVRLTEVDVQWCSGFGGLLSLKADDVLRALSTQNEQIPGDRFIVRACFLMEFDGVSVPRRITVRAGNVAEYTRECDIIVAEEWLARRGFIIRKSARGSS